MWKKCILTWRKGSFKTLLLLIQLQIHRWPWGEIDKDINLQFQSVCMLLRKAIWYSEDRLLLVSRWIIFDYNISPSALSQYDWYKGTDCRRLEDENGGQLIILTNQHRNLGGFLSKTEVTGGFHASSPLYYYRITGDIKCILDICCASDRTKTRLKNSTNSIHIWQNVTRNFLEKAMATHSSGLGNSQCLGNPMDRGAWWATVHGVAKSWTRLSDWT